jgi:hypothetical protein
MPDDGTMPKEGNPFHALRTNPQQVCVLSEFIHDGVKFHLLGPRLVRCLENELPLGDGGA